MVEEKIVLGRTNRDNVTIILSGSDEERKQARNGYILKNMIENTSVGDKLRYSFVVARDPDRDGEVRIYTFDSYYTVEELRHMQEALRQIAGDGT